MSDTPDFSAMTPAQRDAWLAGRRSSAPAVAKPILVAALLSLLWFTLISPAVGLSLGERLLPEATEVGTALIGADSCRRSVPSLGTHLRCSAQITWQDGRITEEPVLARQQPDSPVSVERHRLRSGRDTASSTLSSTTRVVVEGYPTGTAGAVGQLTLINLAVIAAVWLGCGLWIRRIMAPTRPNLGS